MADVPQPPADSVCRPAQSLLVVLREPPLFLNVPPRRGGVSAVGRDRCAGTNTPRSTKEGKALQLGCSCHASRHAVRETALGRRTRDKTAACFIPLPSALPFASRAIETKGGLPWDERCRVSSGGNGERELLHWASKVEICESHCTTPQPDTRNAPLAERELECKHPKI